METKIRIAEQAVWSLGNIILHVLDLIENESRKWGNKWSKYTIGPQISIYIKRRLNNLSQIDWNSRSI